ncbi:MAG: DNA-binding response regulator [Phycisphaerales bacterium]|nr:DNA-binding response regulator [Phycisphaerales bacterium]
MTPDTPETLVLIVDDDPTLRGGIAALLGFERHATLTAATVAEAHGRLDAQIPTHALLDLNLPDGLGTAILRRIRDESRPVRVAMISGNADDAAMAEARALGVDAVFVKPPEWDEVLQWVAQP